MHNKNYAYKFLAIRDSVGQHPGLHVILTRVTIVETIRLICRIQCNLIFLFGDSHERLFDNFLMQCKHYGEFRIQK